MLNRTAQFVLLAFFVIAPSCYYDKGELLRPEGNINCSTANAKFLNVQPIISSKCATVGCHDSFTAAGNTVLLTYDQVKAKADRIYNRAIIQKSMPPLQPLTANEIALIKCWIDSGTPNN